MIETTIWTVFVAAIVSLIVVRILTPRIPRGRVVLMEDPEGHARVELVAEPQGAWPAGVIGLRFLTKQGKHRLGLGVFEDEGTLALLDETGLSRLSIRMEETCPRIIFWQHRQPPGIGGTRRIVLGLKPDGSHTLEFMHEDGTCRASLGVQNEGTAFLKLYDANGHVIWKAP
jgi:hypothetical protein